VLFVDDSTDGTPTAVRAAAMGSRLPLRVRHRDVPAGGLSGAVFEGIGLARGRVVVVMDADLQHPPSAIPLLLDRIDGGADLAVASRYVGDGAADGLSSPWRHLVSRGSAVISKALLRGPLAQCSDPGTGFFAVRRDRLRLDRLNHAGFKALLEILGTHELNLAEVPFVFCARHAGDSKATFRQGVYFLRQLVELRSAWRRAHLRRPLAEGAPDAFV
jgi:dolichol-phosphate mannosyltransferase